MTKKYERIQQLIDTHINTLEELKELNVIRNKTSFTSQLGEFIASEIYQGTLAKTSTQKGWDLILEDGRKVQVKAHSKSFTNRNYWTPAPYKGDADIDLYIIIVFSEEYKLKHFFEVSWNEVFALCKLTKIRNIKWSQLKTFDKLFDLDFRKKKIIKSFLE